MQIFVEFEGIKVLDVKADTTVLRLKQVLEKKTNVAANQQQLSLKGLGKILMDDRTMSDYNIQNQANLVLMIRRAGQILSAPVQDRNLTWDIKTCTGQILSLPAHDRKDTISTIKPKIETLVGIPVARQIFVSKGTALSGTASLADHLSVVDSSVSYSSRNRHPVVLQFTINVYIPVLARSIAVNPKCTVMSLKEALFLETGIDVHFQSLFLEEKSLADPDCGTSNLHALGVNFGSQLRLHVYGEETQADVTEAVANELGSFSRNISEAQNLLRNYQRAIRSATSLASLDAASIVALSESQETISRCCHDDLATLSIVITSAQNKLHQQHIQTMKRYKDHSRNQAATLDKLNREIVQIEREIKRLRQKEDALKEQRAAIENRVSLENALNSSNKQRKRTLKDNLAMARQSSNGLLASHESLQASILTKITEFETEYEKWNKCDVIQWILMIENGRFKGDQFGSFIQSLKEMEINGAELCELNNKFVLISAGLHLDSDQRILRRHISRVVDGQSNDKRRDICGICVENMVNTVVLPCGHQYYCYQCSQRERLQRCPICRKPITEIVQTFMSGFSK